MSKTLSDEQRQKTAHQTEQYGMVGYSPAMQEIYQTIAHFAAKQVSSTVLITGESGTGKELVAHALHKSLRPDGPFIATNVCALPEDLLESELFGHVRGAFTGAMVATEGYIRKARGGTLFLDEIGDMPITSQVKVLRFLQDMKISPVGSTYAEKIDVRVVAATNKNLEKAIEEKQFREDLYYRLNVINIRMPALRERPQDIMLLAEHFIDFYAKKYNQPAMSLPTIANELFTTYKWPGNVRELENLMERIVIYRPELKPEGENKAILPETYVENIFNKGIKKKSAHESTDPYQRNINLNDTIKVFEEGSYDQMKEAFINAFVQRVNQYRTQKEAAKDLGLSQSTISQMILRFEKDNKPYKKNRITYKWK